MGKLHDALDQAAIVDQCRGSRALTSRPAGRELFEQGYALHAELESEDADYA
ncbi:MAG TPA: hypothetical protein VNY31_06665 [Solirubrobacteraceae bacterium]|jgi:hypothetical protein|nr:hypothetical protein [Solirubrobacteraceae bacterium]